MPPLPDSIPWTGDAEADRLLAADPTALLIGFVLDQQVTVQKAFGGPLVLWQRLGHLDPARIAAMPADEFAEVVRERPALHRFPVAMARRVQALCQALAEEFDGDASRVWKEAADGPDLLRRLGSLPGLGPMKVGSLTTLLHRRYGVRLAGLEALLPTHPTLGAVDSAQGLADYQAHKRARKAEARRAATEPSAS